MIRIIITPDKQCDPPNQFTIEMAEIGHAYRGTVVKAEISGPSGAAAMAHALGHVSFVLTGKDVIVE